MSLKDRVLASITQPRPRKASETITLGMHLIMRKYQGYKHFDFFHPDFQSSQFFALLDLIREEAEEEKRAYEKAKKQSKGK